MCLCVKGRCLQTGEVICVDWSTGEAGPERNFSLLGLIKKKGRGEPGPSGELGEPGEPGGPGQQGELVGSGVVRVAPLFAALRAAYPIICHPKSARHFNSAAFVADWAAQPLGRLQRGKPSCDQRISAQDIAFRELARAAASGEGRDAAAAAAAAKGVTWGWVLKLMLRRIFDDEGAVRESMRALFEQL
ncbi:MAG: hypothetical protein J3K34DRAFT_17272 [Monoraphidium minutum]|nr:MAG: hypothetical protein J3K34DRAFT_17272 [Monoraphidium minutum]